MAHGRLLFIMHSGRHPPNPYRVAPSLHRCCTPAADPHNDRREAVSNERRERETQGHSHEAERSGSHRRARSIGSGDSTRDVARRRRAGAHRSELGLPRSSHGGGRSILRPRGSGAGGRRSSQAGWPRLARGGHRSRDPDRNPPLRPPGRFGRRCRCRGNRSSTRRGRDPRHTQAAQRSRLV
jgi:hypothetical protein